MQRKRKMKILTWNRYDFSKHFTFLSFFFVINFFGVTLVNKVIEISSIHFCNTFRRLHCVFPTHRAPPFPFHLTPLTLFYLPLWAPLNSSVSMSSVCLILLWICVYFLSASLKLYFDSLLEFYISILQIKSLQSLTQWWSWRVKVVFKPLYTPV